MYVFTYVSIYLLCLKSMFIQNTYSIHLHWIRNNTVFCAHGWFYVFFSKSRYATTALLLRLILYCCHQCPIATYSFNLEASTPSQIPCAQAKTVFLQEASPCPWRRVVRQRTQCLRTCSTHHIMLKRSENVILFFRDMKTTLISRSNSTACRQSFALQEIARVRTAWRPFVSDQATSTCRKKNWFIDLSLSAPIKKYLLHWTPYNAAEH